MSNAAKNVDILATILAKILDLSEKLFFPCINQYYLVSIFKKLHFRYSYKFKLAV